MLNLCKLTLGLRVCQRFSLWNSPFEVFPFPALPKNILSKKFHQIDALSYKHIHSVRRIKDEYANNFYLSQLRKLPHTTLPWQVRETFGLPYTKAQCLKASRTKFQQYLLMLVSCQRDKLCGRGVGACCRHYTAKQFLLCT